MKATKVNHRLVAICSVISISFLTAILGCSGAKNNRVATATSDFSIEDARTALVDLLERSDNQPLKLSLPLLTTVKPQNDKDGSTKLGPWVVFLKDRRFVVTIISDEIFEEYAGKFERAKNGSWTATIRQETRT